MPSPSQTFSETRLSAVSVCRCFAMILILLCHFLQFYQLEIAWWLNVGVQMFLFLSGYLYGGKKIGPGGQFLLRNIKKICIPYYCYLLPVLIIYGVFAAEYLKVESVITSLFCVGTVNGLSHLWYIEYILICYLLTPVLAVLVGKTEKLYWVKYITVCVLMVAVGQIVTLPFYSWFRFDCVACYMTGFYAAVFRKRYGPVLSRRVSRVLIALAIAANALRICVRYVFKLDIPGFGLYERYAHLLLGAALVLVILVMFGALKENIILKLSDRYSYPIYIVHHLFILSPFSLMEITRIHPLNWLMVIAATCICAAVLELLSNKVNILLSPLRR